MATPPAVRECLPSSYFRIGGNTHGYLYSLSATLEERKEQKCGRAGLQWRRKLETWTP
jgi:hypothetical protein